MSDTDLVQEQQRIVDANHLNILKIFYYVFAGFAVLGLGFLFLHFLLFNWIFANPEFFKSAGSPPPIQNMMVFLRIFYCVFGVLMLSAALLFFFAARFLGNKTHKTFVLVVGAMTCFLFPIGTVLGVFTLMILSRDSMKHLFRS